VGVVECRHTRFGSECWGVPSACGCKSRRPHSMYNPLMAKKITDPGLKLNVTWEEAARRLLNTKPGSTPPRAVTPRKKKAAKRTKR
jgi:hypothetical protein